MLSRGRQKLDRCKFYNPIDCTELIEGLKFEIRRQRFGFRITTKEEESDLRQVFGSRTNFKLKRGDCLHVGTHHLKMVTALEEPQLWRELELDESDKSCRICYLSSESEEDPLLSVCKCAGSISHIHLYCLRTWYDHKNVNFKAVEDIKIQEIRSLRCDLCKSQIPQSVMLGDEPVLTFNQPRLVYPVVWLEEPSTNPQFLKRNIYFQRMELKQPRTILLSDLRHLAEQRQYPEHSLELTLKRRGEVEGKASCETQLSSERGCEIVVGLQHMYFRKGERQFLVYCVAQPSNGTTEQQLLDSD